MNESVCCSASVNILLRVQTSAVKGFGNVLCRCFLQSSYFAHTPLQGLYFFRFHFPEGLIVKIVAFKKIFECVRLKVSFVWDVTRSLFSFCSWGSPSIFCAVEQIKGRLHGERFPVTFDQGKLVFQGQIFQSLWSKTTNLESDSVFVWAFVP